MHAGSQAASACRPASYCDSAACKPSLAASAIGGSYNAGAYQWLCEPSSEQPALELNNNDSAQKMAGAIQDRAACAGVKSISIGRIRPGLPLAGQKTSPKRQGCHCKYS